MNKKPIRQLRSLMWIFFFIPALAYAQIPIQSGHSGEWFDPARDGEGFFLEVLEDDRMVFSWFTYDSNGNQMWLVGAGDIVDNKAVIPAFVTEGPVFGPAFDPNEVVLTEWGTVEFSFSSCNQGTATYNSTLGFGSGSIDITRLTLLKQAQCVENPPNILGTYDLESGSLVLSQCDDPRFNGEFPLEEGTLTYDAQAGTDIAGTATVQFTTTLEVEGANQEVLLEEVLEFTGTISEEGIIKGEGRATETAFGQPVGTGTGTFTALLENGRVTTVFLGKRTDTATGQSCTVSAGVTYTRMSEES